MGQRRRLENMQVFLQTKIYFWYPHDVALLKA